jgi:hypothetical protein
MRGRTFKGLRGWSGKPLHPPLTDAPVGAYVLAVTMVTVTVLIIIGICLRVFGYWDEQSTPAIALVLTLIAAARTALGGTIGGSLAYDYGFNVETSGDHPVWHRSELDVFPGHASPPSDSAPRDREIRRDSPAAPRPPVASP